MLKVLVIDEIQERALEICEGLTRAGHMVAAVLADAFELHDKVRQLEPDVILINTDSPSRDTLENLAVLDQHMPRPILMFAEDGTDDAIRQASRPPAWSPCSRSPPLASRSTAICARSATTHSASLPSEPRLTGPRPS